MYKKVSFRSVSKPGRMIAPGFVLCGRMIGQTGVGRGSGPEGMPLRHEWKVGSTWSQTSRIYSFNLRTKNSL
jgi:hypothetical protein